MHGSTVRPSWLSADPARSIPTVWATFKRSIRLVSSSQRYAGPNESTTRAVSLTWSIPHSRMPSPANPGQSI